MYAKIPISWEFCIRKFKAEDVISRLDPVCCKRHIQLHELIKDLRTPDFDSSWPELGDFSHGQETDGPVGRLRGTWDNVTLD